MVAVGRSVLDRFRRFSLYNSPYPAHRQGCAIDLYPERGESVAPSPVAGTVTRVRRVSAPTRSYAAPMDWVVVVDTGTHLARVLHVEPRVSVGDSVAVGEVLGELVTSGYAAPWVPDHLHVGFRERGCDPLRARGSLPVDVGVSPTGVEWDGRGTVVEVGETYVVLDRPDFGAVDGFAGVAAEGGGVLDGGFPHYAGGGWFGGGGGSVRFLGAVVGESSGRDVRWTADDVVVGGESVRGLSLSVGSTGRGVKVVCPDHGFVVGERVSVGVR